MDFSKLPEIIARYPAKPEVLISLLQDIQKEYHYLPAEAMQEAASALGVPLSRVYSVATFYNSFSLEPRGEKVIRVCMGTTCHIKGAGQIVEQLEEKLGIKAGETTEDLKYTLEVVNCVGACSMAPVVIVNEKYHGDVKINQIKKLLK